MSAFRTLLVAAVLALVVALLEQGLVRLVEASGARDAPALILVLLLAAFLGLLTAIGTRSLGLASAMAPTALVLGWIVVPPVLGLVPSAFTQYFAGNAALTTADAVALAVAVIASTLTLSLAPER